MQAETQQFRAEAVDRVLSTHHDQTTPTSGSTSLDMALRRQTQATAKSKTRSESSERIIIERDDEAKLGPWTLVEASRSKRYREKSRKANGKQRKRLRQKQMQRKMHAIESARFCLQAKMGNVAPRKTEATLTTGQSDAPSSKAKPSVESSQKASPCHRQQEPMPLSTAWHCHEQGRSYSDGRPQCHRSCG